LLVLTSRVCKCAINPFINPNPINSHTHTRDNIYFRIDTYFGSGGYLLAATPYIRVTTGAQDTSVSIATVYGQDCRGSIPSMDKRCFSYLHHLDPIQWIPGLFPREIKRRRREADHSPSSSVKNGEDISPFLTHLHGMVLN
jgi:hypothetical protein